DCPGRDAYARECGAGLGWIDFGECRRHVDVCHRLNDGDGEVGDAIEVLVVDFVGGVARTVIVGMRPRREKERRNVRLVEVGTVGRLIWVWRDIQVESGRDIRAFQYARPHVAAAGSVRGQPIVLHPADHVEIEVSGHFGQGYGRVHDERVRTDKADLLPRPTGDTAFA